MRYLAYRVRSATPSGRAGALVCREFDAEEAAKAETSEHT